MSTGYREIDKELVSRGDISKARGILTGYIVATRRKLLDRLSEYDYIGSLKHARRKRYGTTGSWLSGTKAFKDWLEDSKFGTLWLSGICKPSLTDHRRKY